MWLDTLSVDALFKLARIRADADQAWSAFARLQRLSIATVFAEAVQLCRSQDARERRIGVDVLGQWSLRRARLPWQRY